MGPTEPGHSESGGEADGHGLTVTLRGEYRSTLCTRPTAEMDEGEDFIGLMWYIASKTDEEPPLSCIEVSASHIAAGWAHFRSVANSGRGISYSSFSEQIQKGLNTVFKETEVTNNIKTSLEQFLLESVPEFSSQFGSEEKLDAMSGALIEKILDSIPSLSKTVFDIIGN